jgi:hypothetical protein
MGDRAMSNPNLPVELLVKSKKRVADHGEVFTPKWMVDSMLDLVKDESERIESRFLEPACGSGNFLIPVLRRKLRTVQDRFGKSAFEQQQYGLLSLMCIYGIELLGDNAAECRQNLLEEFSAFLKLDCQDPAHKAARAVVEVNIVEGDALTLKRTDGDAIHFSEWAYLGKGKFQRRDFKYDELIQMSSFGEGTLFEAFEPDEIFQPIETYPQMNIQELATAFYTNRSN